jgi:Zn-finger nucleic acid-binding protein
MSACGGSAHERTVRSLIEFLLRCSAPRVGALALTPEKEVVPMKCPIDQAELVMSDRQGIEIDYCPQCRGVWLDRGELDKIIERSASAPTAPDRGRAARDDDGRYEPDRGYDDARPRRRRRGSFLDDLFDFD